MVSSERQHMSAYRQIGYFCRLKLEDRHAAAILITNAIGVPVEFKYTEPVATTKLHKILYGAVLDRYLHETVLRDRLAHELRAEAHYFLTPYEDKDYLSRIAGRESMAVQRFRVPAGESTGPFVRVRDREAIVNIEDGPAIRVAFSTADDAAQTDMATWLQEMARTMDVLEPLDRVATALKALCADGRTN